MISFHSPLNLSKRREKIECVFSVGLTLFILSYFLPISTKAGNNFFYGLVLLPSVLAVIKYRDIFQTGTLFPYFLVMVVVMTITAFPDESKAIKYAFYLIGFWLVTSTVFARKLIDDQRAALWLMIIATLFCIVLLLDHTLLQGNPLNVRPNLYETWRSGSPIAACMLLSFCTATGLSVLMKRKHYLYSLIILIASLVIQSTLQTRTGLVGYLAVLVAYPIVSIPMKTRYQVKQILATVVILTITVFTLYLLGFFEVLIQRGGSYRLEIFQVAVEHYKQCNLVSGCGYNYEFNDALRDGMNVAHPHSIYLSALVYLGPLSLLALLVLQMRAFYVGMKIKTDWLWGMIASSAFFMVDGSKVLDSPSIVWICLLFPLAVIDGLSSRYYNNQN